MSNSFNKSTMVWEVDDTGTLIADAPGITNPIVRKIILIPSAASDSITFTGGGDSETAIFLQSDTSTTTPASIDFGDKGRRISNLTCSAGSTGITKAYVYLL